MRLVRSTDREMTRNRNTNAVEDHFDTIFSRKERIDYQFDLGKMGVKDRKIAQSLMRYGINGKKCLDVGPGTGRWLLYLSQQGASYLGAIDISTKALERCTPICNRIQKANMETDEFAFDSDFFDIVISFEVLEHLRIPNLYLSEMYRVTKNEGIIIMSIPNITSFISRVRMLFGLLPVAVASDPTHVRFYRQEDIIRLFERFHLKPQFISTSISLNPLNPKSKFRLPSTACTSSLVDSLLFLVHVRK